MGKVGYDQRAALANALNTSGKAIAAPPKKEEPKPPPQQPRKKKEAEPAPVQKTKKEVEEEQRKLLEENEQRRKQFFEDEAARKRRERKCVDEAVTYVEDRDTRKPRAVDDLSEYWVSDLGILPFLPSDGVGPGLEVPEEMQVEDRLDYLKMLNEQLRKLLRMKFHVFWSQAIFDENLRRFLDSYLRFCPRSHDQVNGSGEAVTAADDPEAEEEQGLSREISRRALAVFVRLSRPVETDFDFMSEARFSKEIYDKRIFDVPKLIDLCAIYGDSNREEITKLVHSVFSQQPCYKDEFKSVVPQMLGSLQSCCAPLQGPGAEAEAELGVGDCLKFLPDVLSCFISMFCFFPEVCRDQLLEGRLETSAQEAGGGAKLPLADLMVPLHDAITAMQLQDNVDFTGFSAAMLSTIISLLSRLLSLVLGFRMAPRHGPGAFGELLEWLGAQHASDREQLLADLARYGLENVATEWAASSLVDDAQLDALDALFSRPLLPQAARFTRKRGAAVPAGVGGAGARALGTTASSSSSAGAGKNDPSASDATKIREVREVVGPDFGEGFVLQCLLHYGGSVPVVVGHLLDGSLPPQLAALPRGMKLTDDPTTDSGPLGDASPTAEEKRRVLAQASRMDREAAERERLKREAKDDPRKAAALEELEQYDDDVDDTFVPQMGVGATHESSSDEADSRYDDDSDELEGEGDPRWTGSANLGRGGKSKGKGKPRGATQGQTVQARRKEENKAKVANHNRKTGAMRKFAKAA